MRFLACSLGLLLASASCPAIGQAAPRPAGAVQGVSQATAAALARTVAPRELMMAQELEQGRKALLALPALDETAKALEQEYPGMYAALWAAIEPEMRRSTDTSYPSYWAALERLYAARLTENEAQAVLTFFKSATGQKLIRAMYGAFDAAPMVADMVKSDNYVIDEKQMTAATDAAKAKAVKQIGPDDQADLWILMASIDLQKFRAIGAETQKVTLEWVNREDAEEDARTQQIMEQAMKRYMAAHPPKK